MTSGASHEQIPRWAVIADLIAGAALATAALTIVTGGLDRTDLFGFRVSVNRPGRAIFLALAVLAFRHSRERRHPRIGRLWRWLQQPSVADERRLFGPWTGHAPTELLLVIAGFVAIVVAATWPQIRDAYQLPDFSDPLFSVWRISWIAHQLAHNPAELFHGNTFHPERLTLTYSDSVLLQGVVGAPFLWLGVDPLRVYTGLFLGAWVFSGVTTYFLVRALTGRRDAAVIAGTIYAIYPYRFEHYSHLEQVMTAFTPLTLLMLHRTIAGERLRHGLATGLAYSLQMYSCMYAALFLAVFVAPLAAILWVASGGSWRVVRVLAAGAVLAGVLIAPLAAQDMANQPTFGERAIEEIQHYSAVPSDYLKPHPRSRVYGAWHEGGRLERQLFPGLALLVLAAVGLRRPWSAARLGYIVAGAVAFDASLGMNGITYPLLHEYVGVYRGLRVPARFSILFAMSLTVLAGYAAAHLLSRWPARRWLVAAGLFALVTIDLSARVQFVTLARGIPAIYSVIPPEPPSVLAEFPNRGREGRDIYGSRYEYFSTVHWHRILDGNSGFFPPSWHEYNERTEDFPSDDSIAYLRSRGVQYIAIHGWFYDDQETFEATRRHLAARSDMERASAARFSGSMSELYRLK